MKFCFALLVVTTSLSVPSLLGNAFLVGSIGSGQHQTSVASRNAAAPVGVVVLHESVAATSTTDTDKEKEKETF